MRFKGLLVAAALLAGAVNGASAGTIFSDNFDTENSGFAELNYKNFANWNVIGGSVDLIGMQVDGTPYFDLQPGHGLYVDLDGSTNQAGFMMSKSIAVPGAGKYVLTFELAGNQRDNSPELVDVTVTAGGAAAGYSLPKNAPFKHFALPFEVKPGNSQNVNLIFAANGGDNIGMLLDNVQIAPVPLPAAAWASFGMLGLLGIARMRKAWR